MNKMHERFTRAYNILDKAIKERTNTSSHKQLPKPTVDWLCDAAGLWDDWEFDECWVIDGINQDPNFPTILSCSVFNHWLQIKNSRKIDDEFYRCENTKM